MTAQHPTWIRNLLIALLVAALIGLGAAQFAQAASYSVSPDNMQGWFFYDDGVAGTSSGSFVDGPGTLPAGSGSARFVVDGTAAMTLGRPLAPDLMLADLTTLTYWTYRTSGGPALAPALQFNVDYDSSNDDPNVPDDAWQGRLVYEPYQSGVSPSTGVWESWDALDTNAKWWASGAPGDAICPDTNPCTWAQVLAAFPNIGLNDVYPIVMFKAGSGWTGGFDGNVDHFMIGFSGADDTYDFENTPPSVVYVDDDWAGLSFGDDPDGYGSGAQAFGADAFATVEDAVDAVAAGGTIHVAAGIYTTPSQVFIDRDMTIAGADRATTVINPGFNTGNSGDARGWFLVDTGVAFHLSGLTLDGNGQLVFQGIRHKGSGTIDDVAFYEIKYNESGPDYSGVAVAAFGTGNVDITNSTFAEIGRVGVLFFGTGITGSTYSGNTYTGKGPGNWLDYALDINAGAVVDVSNNTVSDNQGVASDSSTSAGYLVTTFNGPGTAVEFTGNDISGNTTGIYVGFNASDTSTVTAHYNRIYNNDSNGLVSTNPFVDAQYNWWGDATGPDTTDGTNAEVNPHGAAALGDAIDGDIDAIPWYATSTTTSATEFVTVTHNPVIALSDTIQGGVDAAVAGDTVTASAGTYVEQVEITKPLTLEGVGPTTVIESPATLTKFFTTSTTNKPIVFIHDTIDVIVQNLTVDGAGKGNANFRFIGIGFWNAGGTVDTVEVLDIRDTPFSGTQHGVAIYSWNDDTVSRTINVWDSTITGFQKNAMALNADDFTPLVVDVSGNTITGAGPTSVTAQNGIQVWADLATGSIHDNEIHDIAYAGSGTVGSSVLLYYADVDVMNNVVTGAQMGIYDFDGQAMLNGNNLAIIKTGDYAWGILATDPPNVVPAPFGETPGGERPAGEAPTALLTVDVSGNTVTFSGPDKTATYGIDALAGYGPDDIALTANGNTVSGFEYGIEVYQLTDDTGVFTSITANNNCLANNDIGFFSNVTAIPVDGTLNGWGDASGPYHPTLNPDGLGSEVSDNVDFIPWLDSCGGAATGNWHNVTQDIYYATLQEAVNASAPGDTIVPVNDGLSGGATITTPNVTINLNGMTAGPGSPFLTVSAADVSVVGPGVLDGAGSPDPAILILAGGDNFTLQDVEVRDWADGVQVAASVTSINIISNFIHSNADAGLQVDAGATIGGVQDIYGNLFKLNTGPGVLHNGGGTINATYNSWGDLDGPFGTDSSYGGDGVGGTGMVSYDPWTFVEFYLDMAPNTEAMQVDVDEGETFTVAIKADAENVNGVVMRMTFDPTLLQLNSVTRVAPWSGAFCSPVSPGPGEVEFICNLFFPATEWDADSGTIALVSFTATGSGLTGPGPWFDLLDIDHTTVEAGAAGGAKIFVNNAGYLAPAQAGRDITDADDGRVDITGIAQYTGFVDLQGRGNDSGATVSVYDAAFILVADATSAASGAYTTAYVNPYVLSIGTTYYLYIDAPLYLPTNILIDGTMESHILDTRPTTLLENVLLLGGDANNDNKIFIGDISCIGGAIGSSSTCGGAGSADVNGDGVVNFTDITLAAGNYELEESPWVP